MSRLRTHQLTWRYGLLALAVAALVIVGVASATPVTGAAFTTTNTGVDGTGHCKNGNEDVNCNIYDGKQFVWLNGGPSTAYVGNGEYFFAVLVPGGQHDPNDGAAKNLSDDFDTYGDRTFSVSGGSVAYTGPHDFDSNKIRLMSYADTTNPGGVYIMAICFLGDGYPVDPSKCKYDAFKIRESDTEEPPASDLLIEKDARSSFTRTFGWTVSKTVDGQESVSYPSSPATRVLTYQVHYLKDEGTDSGWTVSDTITVTNPNSFDVWGVNVTDQLDDGTTCHVDDGQYTDSDSNLQSVAATGGTMPALAVVTFAYACSPTGTTSILNTATVSWRASGPNDALAAGTADGTHGVVWGPPATLHNCVTVSDNNPGNITSGTAPGAPPICDDTTFTYYVTVNVANRCVDINNTAAFVDAADANFHRNDSTSAHICGPVVGGLTMGFWQNNNGQRIIKNGATTSNVCNSGTWLRTFNPFKDLSATANCNAVATYVYNVIKGGGVNCGGVNCNSLLKAQMLATALNVYFSDAALGGNAIGAAAPIGGVNVNITTWKVGFNNQTCLTVGAMLAYAASQSNSGGSSWYGQVKATQERSKSAFDAINNQVAFSC
jgi:hypothetical protein